MLAEVPTKLTPGANVSIKMQKGKLTASWTP